MYKSKFEWINSGGLKDKAEEVLNRYSIWTKKFSTCRYGTRGIRFSNDKTMGKYD